MPRGFHFFFPCRSSEELVCSRASSCSPDPSAFLPPSARDDLAAHQAHSFSPSTLPVMSRLLFVCVHNAGRSVMAEAFARAAGAEPVSAGTIPQEHPHPEVVAAMNEVG